MLLVLSFDDPALVQAATAARNANPAVFGALVTGFGHVPQLMPAENLFITAHGAKVGDDGGPVIGDEAAAFWINARDLVHAIGAVFPPGYTGSVYISACESADCRAGSFSFAEVFKAFLVPSRPRVGGVYGQRGGVGLTVPLPTDPGWVRA